MASAVLYWKMSVGGNATPICCSRCRASCVALSELSPASISGVLGATCSMRVCVSTASSTISSSSAIGGVAVGQSARPSLAELATTRSPSVVTCHVASRSSDSNGRARRRDKSCRVGAPPGSASTYTSANGSHRAGSEAIIPARSSRSEGAGPGRSTTATPTTSPSSQCGVGKATTSDTASWPRLSASSISKGEKSSSWI